MYRGKIRKLRSLVTSRNKEVMDEKALAVAGGTITDFDILTAVNDYIGTPGTCSIGSVIRGIDIQFSAVGFAGNTFDFFLYKRVGLAAVANYPAPGGVGGHVNRSKVIHEISGMCADRNNATPNERHIFVAIPKHMQRMTEGDTIASRFVSSLDYSVCIKYIFKTLS